MIRSRISCLLLCTIAFISLHLATWAQDRSKISEADKVALAKTGEAIRAAFARGDADAIMKYHHADVVKSLSPTKFLVGRDAVKADLEDSFRIFYLEFEENRVENVLFLDRCAVEISTFTIDRKSTRLNSSHLGIP